MNKSEKLFRRLLEGRLIALLSPKSAEECLRAYEAFDPRGVVLEVAFRTEHALEGIELVLERHPEALLLAGTVMTAGQAEAAIDAGAAGVVSADYFPEVVDACVRRDVMCIPGGLSDAGKQLAQKAAAYGCSLDELRSQRPYQWVYKLFPTFAGDHCYADLAPALRGPFKDLVVVYTGGVSLGNVAVLARKDPTGIFCGSALTKRVDDAQFLAEEIGRWQAAVRPGAPPKREPSPQDETAGGRSRIVAFGELMARLSPTPGVRLGNARGFELHFGGAEANVAVSLARFGHDAAFVTALPDNDIGDNAVAALRAAGVDTGSIIRSGPRIGIYYLEHGAGPRPSKVIYDRLPSALSEIVPDAFDWEAALAGAHWFHWTGITPALGDNVAAALRRALEAAKRLGITVSADLNYRGKLWSREKARAVMTGLMPYVDLLVANEEDPESIFGIKPAGTDVEAGRIDHEAYRAVAEELISRFGLRKVAITLRESFSASENRWSACLHDGRGFHLSPCYHVWIVDRVGAGDAFAAGLIHGLLGDMGDAEALEFGVAASCLKHSVAGDFNLATVEEVWRLAAGRTGGRVQR